MMRFTLVSPCVIALLALAPTRGFTATTLDIYFIDVEGGQSTLMVTPQRQSFLVDTGWAGSGAPGSKPGDTIENPRSTGVVVTFGKFRFLDVGDLTGQPLFDLVCPKSLIGPVGAYLVAHHGNADASDPTTFAAFKPRVAIMNNGTKKGGAQATYESLHHVRGLEDVWQLHRSEAAGDKNFPAERIANLDESTAHWIKLSAAEDGSFRVLNGRTGEWKTYPAH
jgi:hypothetical protein